jgi:hypothetical protein
MNELTKFLIEELLDESKTVALYGGGFKPPTKGHFTVVELALNELPDIDELKVLVGQGVRDGITQEESLAVWNIYKNYLSPKVVIEPSIAPVKSVLNYAKDNPDTKVYWILGARDGEEGDLEDIARRTKTISKYPNLEVKVITSTGGVSGTKARKAVKDNNKEQFLQSIPDIKEKEQIWNIVFPVINEVGEANLKPYKWKEVDRESYFVYTRFVTDSETQYDVDLKSTNYVDDDLNNLRALGIEFSAKLKGDEGSSAKIVVNKGELYRVMATITAIVKTYIKKSKAQAILYSPSKKSDEEDFGSQRDNLYRAFISKAFPGVKFKQDGEIVAAILPDTQINEDDPKVGTGKKPKGSSRRLYTDEDPKDTVSIKFKTKEDIVDTLNKTSFKAKSHARQSQIINVVHQRVRAAYSKAKDPEVKSRLKRALDYIEKRKEMSKKKTERLRKMKEASDPQAGTALPYGSGFAPVKELVTSTEVICDNCSWEWNKKDGGKDLYICHKCGHDNTPNKLNEGRYDSITNQLSKLAFKAFKDVYDSGDKKGEFSFTVGPDDEDIQSNEFEFDYTGVVEITDDEYMVDGGANAGFDDEGDEITPSIVLKFRIPQNPDWQKVSFDIKDVVRHELEHLTQDGLNLKGNVDIDDPRAQNDPKLTRPGKYMQDDQFIRDMIDMDLLPKADYFRLEKEIDAMLQGLYFKAKKSRTPFKDVVNDYFEKVGLEGEDKQDILDLWTKRLKALNLPAIQENDIFGLNKLAKTFIKETFEKAWNLQEGMLSLSKYMIDNGMNIKPLPKIKVIKDDEENASHLLGKTAYYDPNNKSITLYTMNRHPKDVLRSFAHEMVHHEQNLEGRLNNINTTNTNEDGDLPEIEKEAYEKGNMMLRNWEDSIKNV